MKKGRRKERRKVSHVSGAPESELLENKVECYSSKYRLYICKKMMKLIKSIW